MRKKRAAYRVSATAAAKGLGGLVDKVREHRATFIVERGGVPVAQIGPVPDQPCTVAEVVSHLRAVRKTGDAFAREVRRGIRRLNVPAVPHDPWAS